MIGLFIGALFGVAFAYFLDVTWWLTLLGGIVGIVVEIGIRLLAGDTPGGGSGSESSSDDGIFTWLVYMNAANTISDGGASWGGSSDCGGSSGGGGE